MKLYIVLILFIFLFVNKVFTQKHDNIWLIGHSVTEADDDPYGMNQLEFKEDTIEISEVFFTDIEFNSNAVTISDENGDLQFFTNGNHIENHTGEIMENGDGMQDRDRDYGYITPQGVLALPFPKQEEQYILLHTVNGWVDLPDFTIEVTESYYSIIDMQENDGFGKVILPKEPFIIDTLQYGKLTATKHANGRDWWIPINESHTNRFYTILLEPSGLNILGKQSIGENEVEGLGQAVFSPDGSKYANFSSIDTNKGSYLNVFSFDRCSGQFSDPTQIHFTNVSGSGGVAFSPNSRYLYLSFYNYIYQYDLLADDLLESEIVVAEYDGYESVFPTRFFLAQLAPNGKIYISTNNGADILHVIHNPDEKGLACNVEQHGLQLATRYAFSMPNYPNYRLGALEGSPCDSLTTSTEETIFEEEINIYPNPVTDMITIESEQLQDAIFYLTDALGREVLIQKIVGKQEQITVDFLAKGVYFYMIKDDGKQLKSGKLVVQ